jgi:hypothetical protein
MASSSPAPPNWDPDGLEPLSRLVLAAAEGAAGLALWGHRCGQRMTEGIEALAPTRSPCLRIWQKRTQFKLNDYRFAATLAPHYSAREPLRHQIRTEELDPEQALSHAG